ncbi:MAG: DoxX family protein [Ignavibacteria bacterium]|nr:DoxX family protein [Ignavibacteria bacterium]
MNLQRFATLFTQPWATDALPTLIRIMLGVLLVYHGSSKVFDGMGDMIQGITDRGWPSQCSKHSWPPSNSLAACSSSLASRPVPWH